MPLLSLQSAKSFGFGKLDAVTENNSYFSIATTSVANGSSISNYTFSSIPQTYKHLELRLFLRDSGSTGSGETQIGLNGYTTNGSQGTTYYWKYALQSNGGSATGVSYNNTDAGFYGPPYPRSSGAESATMGVQVLRFLNYTNTSMYKTMHSYGGHADANYQAYAQWGGTFARTEAITSITINPNQTGFKGYTHMALYGIKG
jgi:hypothetical protein